MRHYVGVFVMVVFLAGTSCDTKTPSRSEADKTEAVFPPYVTYVTKAITDEKILPHTFVGSPFPSTELAVTACPGEYEPATFSVSAYRQVKGLRVTATELKSERHTIPAKAIDIYAVKCWFQSGVESWETDKCVLTPELLLKDDSLVKVDLEKKENWLRRNNTDDTAEYVLISGPTSENTKDIQPQDAKTLQPVDIPKETIKQFWVTVHVPKDAVAGEYRGTLTLSATNAPPTELTVRVKVLPFALEKPVLRYSIYYRAKLTKDDRGSIGSEYKSRKQFEAELLDMQAHGVDYPISYQEYDEELLAQMFEIREKVGLPKGSFYTIGTFVGNPQSDDKETLEALTKNVKKWKQFVKEFGYDEIYFFGLDEAKGALLKSQRTAWETVHEAGGKIFVACAEGAFELVGDLLDLAIYSGVPAVLGPTFPYRNGVLYSYAYDSAPIPAEAAKFHKAGNKIFSYGNPMVGMEVPESYRRNYGVVLWRAGYDGAMNYAYQHAFNQVWNDFDHESVRDHTFTYMTVDGVIGTVEWEGWREGVDDVRYLSTLLKAIEKAKTEKPELATEAQDWVDAIDPKGDLDVLRSKMIERILRLK